MLVSQSRSLLSLSCLFPVFAQCSFGEGVSDLAGVDLVPLVPVASVHSCDKVLDLVQVLLDLTVDLGVLVPPLPLLLAALAVQLSVLAHGCHPREPPHLRRSRPQHLPVHRADCLRAPRRLHDLLLCKVIIIIINYRVC